ncbi:MAG: zf-HC2 domain-containing protein [Planctomycetota bacterium]
MDCSEATSRIQLFLAGDLPDQERRGLRGHFTACLSCRLELATQNRIGRGFAALREGAPNPADSSVETPAEGGLAAEQFFDELQADCLQALAISTGERPRRLGRSALRSLAAVLVLGLAAFFTWSSDRTPDSRRSEPGRPAVGPLGLDVTPVADRAPERAASGLLARLEALREAREFELAGTIPVRRDRSEPDRSEVEGTGPIGPSTDVAFAQNFWVRPLERQSRLEDLRRRQDGGSGLLDRVRSVFDLLSEDSVEPLRSLWFDRSSRSR